MAVKETDESPTQKQMLQVEVLKVVVVTRGCIFEGAELWSRQGCTVLSHVVEVPASTRPRPRPSH